MANTYFLISSNVLSTSTATVTFTSIPATYTDLVFTISARSDVVAANDTLVVKFNNDNTGTYPIGTTMIRGDGSATRSAATSGAGTMNARQIDASNSTANTFGFTEIYISSYTASQSKPTSIRFADENNSTTAFSGIISGIYVNNAAISRIDFTLSSGPNFVSGSSFYLYGISNA